MAKSSGNSSGVLANSKYGLEPNYRQDLTNCKTVIAQRNGCYVDGETIMALQYYIGAQLMGRQDIAHLESQYSWAQIRLAAYILGSRPSAQVPRR